MNYVIVTGASKGIGKAIAFELAGRGFGILLVARNEDLLKQVANEIAVNHNTPVHFFAIDLTEASAPQKIVEWINQNQFNVQILVNNAGYGLSGSFEKYSLAEQVNMMQLNMHVPVALTHLLLPILKKQDKSFIMNIASGAAYQAVPGLNVYAATKSFLLSFSRAMNYELRNTTVSVTAVCPGATETDFANRANVTGAKAKKMAEKFNMQPAEVAKIAINGMFASKIEVVPGFVNKLAVLLAWILPKYLLEKSAASIYDL
jgi:hypothetical protein